MRRLLPILLWLAIPFRGGAQISVEEGVSPDAMVREIFQGAGVVVSEVKFTGGRAGLGRFRDEGGVIGLKEGLVLSTGRASHAIGPNSDPAKGTNLREPGDRMLSYLARYKTYDATVLEFDFVPASDSIHFVYFFASEEFIEYVGTQYNDVFAFWISGPGYKTATNIATLPNKKPITVNTVNHIVSRHLYVDNNCWTPRGKVQASQSKTLDADLLNTLEFDGMTTFLRARARVYPGQTYHIKIAIADVSDPLFDSAVFLEGKSFTSAPYDPNELANRPTKMVPVAIKRPKASPADTLVAVEENPRPAPVPVVGPPLTYPGIADLPKGTWERPAHPLYFDFDARTWVEGDSSSFTLEAAWNHWKRTPGAYLILSGHTDNLGSEKYNETLSADRCHSVRQWFVDHGVPAEKIQFFPKGELEPVAPNEGEKGRARNRRVEIWVWREK